jgi:hypothetical protein
MFLLLLLLLNECRPCGKLLNYARFVCDTVNSSAGGMLRVEAFKAGEAKDHCGKGRSDRTPSGGEISW